MQRVSVDELQKNFLSYMAQVEAGEHLIILRGKKL
jgi:antitoxin (DNA-binding transcriptional repressor) of toxin-antitoxin stability system